MNEKRNFRVVLKLGKIDPTIEDRFPEIYLYYKIDEEYEEEISDRISLIFDDCKKTIDNIINDYKKR